MVKRKIAGDDDSDIVTAEKPKPKKKTNGVKDAPAVLALVPKGARRRGSTSAKKGARPSRRVKNPAPGGGKPELTPEQALAQAWDYTYNHRGGFQQ